ncbi:MAG: G5 domain-containing protein [Oscillospiraceae bacterium]|nr:G5 domain-containing protein [Oscillospiraceae bacterium]
MERTKETTKRNSPLLRAVICAVLAVLILFSAAFFARGADGLDSMDLPTVAEYNADLTDQLEAAGVELGLEDYISVGPEGGVLELWIARRNTVDVTVDGVEMKMLSNGEHLGTLLEIAGVTVGPEDLLIIGRGDGDTTFRLTVVRCTSWDEYRDVTIPRPVSQVTDDTLFEGYTRTLQMGYDGLQRDTYRVYQLNGNYTYEVLTDSRRVTEPQEQIVAVGTLPAPELHWLSVSNDRIVSQDGNTITMTSGETYHYSKVINVLATAYTTEGMKWNITSTGTTARVGAIAVDPRVIPYNSRMYIVTDDGSIIYGIATAEDCGGLIKGNRVDLFFNTRYECIQFGARNCTIYILDD